MAIHDADSPPHAPRQRCFTNLDQLCHDALRASCINGFRASLTVRDGFTEVLVDEEELRQALIVLMGICVPASPKAGAVAFEATLDRDAKALRFAVVTTHPVSLDMGARRAIEGVRRRMDHLGADVVVERMPAGALALYVTAPFGDAEEAARDASTSAPPSGERDRGEAPRTAPSALVLLVEDDENNVAVVREYLDARGFDVAVARDGREAITLARELAPTLVLMDVQMPGMDGLEAMRALRADPSDALRRMPIIAYTALVMPGDRERCLAAGADAYIEKPIPLRELADMVAARLSQHAPGPVGGS